MKTPSTTRDADAEKLANGLRDIAQDIRDHESAYRATGCGCGECPQCDARAINLDARADKLEEFAAALLERQAAPDAWQPIETAPKYQRIVAAYFYGNEHDKGFNAAYDLEFARWIDGGWNDDENNRVMVTHWLDLSPPPPKETP